MTSYAYTVGPEGSSSTMTVGADQTTERVMDVRGRVITSTDATGRTTTYVYDIENQVLTITAPDGVVTSTRTYDALHRLDSDTDGEGRTISYAYDADGRMSSYTDARDETYQFEYDHNGRLTKRIFPDNSFRTHTYDAAGRLGSTTKPSGAMATFGYDLRDRILSQTWDDGTPDTTYAYDDAGRQLSAAHGTTHIDRTYDDAGRILTETQTEGSNTFNLAYGYDADGLLSTITRPDGSEVGYGYQATRRLGSVMVGAAPPAATYNRDDRGMVDGVAFEGGALDTTITRDDAGRVLDIDHRHDGTVVGGSAYGYDDAGQRVSLTRADNRQDSYGYDDARQVTSGTLQLHGGGSRTLGYVYDPAGNRSATTSSITNPNSYIANQLNQYTNVGGTARSHDGDGNLTADGTFAYGWDAHDRLKTLNRIDGSMNADYVYDAMGRRVAKTVTTAGGGTETRRFAYAGWNVVYETRTDTDPAAEETWYARAYAWGEDLSGSLQGAGGVGGLLMMEQIEDNATAAYFYAYDGNGNVTEIVDASGTVQARYEYDPYGNLTRAEEALASSNSYRFSTKYQDAESGLLYYGYRYYDPVTGRWPSRDPIEERGGVNLYGFVGNEGVNAVDLLGLILSGCSGSNKPSRPSPWSMECDQCEKDNGDWKQTCWLVKGGKREHEFTTNDYSEYVPGKKGNQPGAKLPCSQNYTVENDNSGTFGPNTPTITNTENNVPGDVKLPDGTSKTLIRIHPQVNRSEGCFTITDTDENAEDRTGTGNDDIRSPHVNLIRELLKKYGSMNLEIKCVGCCKDSQNDQ